MYINFRKFKQYFLILIIIIGIISSGCDLSPVLVDNEKSKPEMRDQLSIILTPTGHDKQNDRLTLEFTGSTAIIDVVSPTGIGRAKITATNGHWPQRLKFRLHLQALEGFEVSNGNHHFSYALEPAENDSRYNQVQAGQKPDPIEVEIPPAWLEGAPDSLDIQWIDWYR